MSNIIYESQRGYDVIPVVDVLMKTREIFLCNAVDSQSCSELIKQMLFLDRQEEQEEITLYINSQGGEVQAGLAVYDTIRMLQSSLKTVCIGICASMGAIIYLAGDKREMMEHGKIMLHDPSYSGEHNTGGKKPAELQAELDDLNRCRESLAKIIAERTGKSIEDIYEITANDTYYCAEGAIKYGLATKILKRGDKQNS